MIAWSKSLFETLKTTVYIQRSSVKLQPGATVKFKPLTKCVFSPLPGYDPCMRKVFGTVQTVDRIEVNLGHCFTIKGPFVHPVLGHEIHWEYSWIEEPV